ncbi:hypothetical protein KCV87_05470 [Actinosynnema pretiosum subsp. pretiosum]|uniref:Carrier domain-containing protein n=2 Tax=Actinosynnema TaxID=40566 RepID=A0AA45LA28_9PSEU|nr:hypothetical protein KCV87_05470 [Actinosynnema pretiosum subsp. pretiosum]
MMSVEELARLVAGVWAELLGVEVGVDDDFYGVGGHSLIAVRTAARLRAELGLRVPVRVIMENPTPNALAALLADAVASAARWPPPVPFRTVSGWSLMEQSGTTVLIQSGMLKH